MSQVIATETQYNIAEDQAVFEAANDNDPSPTATVRSSWDGIDTTSAGAETNDDDDAAASPNDPLASFNAIAYGNEIDTCEKWVGIQPSHELVDLIPGALPIPAPSPA